jgi:hypothetical protein
MVQIILQRYEGTFVHIDRSLLNLGMVLLWGAVKI